MPTYKLLDEFAGLFSGIAYLHRVSTLGDHVAGFLYEDLFDLARSPKLVSRVQSQTRVLNKANKAIGRKARRGDGTFGERVPSSPPQSFPDLHVARADIATLEIGVEVKILTKAMVRQVGRVCSDMKDQAAEFRKHHRTAICVGIVGINHAASYTGYEGDREWPTTGKGKYKHPIQEAADAERHIMTNVAPVYDELVILRFDATNVRPYPFRWVNAAQTQRDYSRIASEYERRF